MLKWMLGLINSSLGFRRTEAVIYKSWKLGKTFGITNAPHQWVALSCESSFAKAGQQIKVWSAPHKTRDGPAVRGHTGTSRGFQTSPDHWLMPLQSSEARDTTCLCNSSLMQPVTMATRAHCVLRGQCYMEPGKPVLPNHRCPVMNEGDVQTQSGSAQKNWHHSNRHFLDSN